MFLGGEIEELMALIQLPGYVFVSIYLYKLLNREVITQLCIPPVSPWLFVDCHAIFPLMRQKMSWIVAIWTSVISSMLTDTASSPAIICYNCIPNWAENFKNIISMWHV